MKSPRDLTENPWHRSQGKKTVKRTKKWPHTAFLTLQSVSSPRNRTLTRIFHAQFSASQNKKLGVPYGSGSILTTGTSLLSKNLFSGTGGISSGRTTGLSRFVLRSTLSATSLLSERLLRERAGWEITDSWENPLSNWIPRQDASNLKLAYQPKRVPQPILG